MKVLKILLFLVAIILVAGVILNYISPNDVHVYESIEIDASPEIVYPFVSNLERMGEWGTWQKKDPAMKATLTGVDGTVGAISAWESDHKEVGVGEQEIVKLIPNKLVETKLRFKKPWESEGDSYVKLEKNEGKTTITWGMKTEVSFPANIMMKFMDGALRKDFTEGLGNLKTLVESKPKMESKTKSSVIDGFSFKKVNRPAQIYLTKREVVVFDDLEKYIELNKPAIYNVLLASGGELTGNPSAFYYNWDEANNTADLALALPIATKINAEGYTSEEQPAGLTLMTTYMGPHDGVANAHYAMEDYMSVNGYEMNGLVLEEFVNDPTTAKDPSQIQTDIYYYVKKKEAL